MTEETQTAEYISFQKTEKSNGNSNYQQVIGKLDALWTGKFVLRSCKENGKIRVTAVTPKKGIKYYPLPEKLTQNLVNEYASKQGTLVLHFIDKPRLSISRFKHKCFKSGDETFCVVPAPRKRRVILHRNSITDDECYLWAGPKEGASVTALRCHWCWCKDVSEMVGLELANRKEKH